MLNRFKREVKKKIYNINFIANLVEKIYSEQGINITLKKLINEKLIDKDLIKNIYDIGCHKGLWTNEIKEIFPKANIYQFDAINYEKKSHRNTFFYEVCLGSINEKKYFYTKGLSGDSLFREKDNKLSKINYTEKDKKLMNIYSLDYFTDINKIPKPDYLKIDAQGAELIILKGGENILKDTKFVQLEVSYVDYNLGGCMVEDILKQMRLKRFLPVGFNHIKGDTYNIIQGDILFHKFSEFDYFK